MRRFASAAFALVLSASFYLLLIDNVQSPELYALAGVALLATLAFWLSREQGFTEAAITWRWLLGAGRAFVRVPAQIVLLAGEALAQLVAPRRARGSWRAVPFRGGESAEDVGRRALTEWFGSVAPNAIVIGIDPDRELLLVHQLRWQGGADEFDVLRLG
ncbi:MAG: hypothetical protein JO153_18140 [Solirubrobacterales bacterium]|nr:hypothetical protein [Solirubrobacterales bacterium]